MTKAPKAFTIKQLPKKRGRPRKETSGGGDPTATTITETTRTTKRFVDLKRTPKDKKKIEEQRNKLIAENYHNSTAHNHYSPVYIHHHYQLTPKKLNKPENPNHWTNNASHTNWLHLWHIQEQIVELRRKFFTNVDWTVFTIINSLEESYRELLISGDKTRFYNTQTLVNYYITHNAHQLQSNLNNYVQTFYNHPQNYKFPADTFQQAFHNPSPSLSPEPLTSESEYIDELRPTITNPNNDTRVQTCNPISGQLV